MLSRLAALALHPAPPTRLPALLPALLAALLPALLAGCELTDPADEFAFTWSGVHTPDLNGEVHFDPSMALPVRLAVTNPLDEPATLYLDEVVLRPVDGSSEVVVAAADELALAAGDARELPVGEVTLLPADRCLLFASAVLVGDETETQVELDATSEVIVLYVDE